MAALCARALLAERAPQVTICPAVCACLAHLGCSWMTQCPMCACMALLLCIVCDQVPRERLHGALEVR